MEDSKIDIYKILNDIVGPESRKLSIKAFESEQYEKLTLESEKYIYMLLKNIASLSVEYKDGEIKIIPRIEIYGEERTFGLQDLTDDDFKILEEIDVDRLPVLLKARVAEILWIVKKNHKVVPAAIEAYRKLYSITYDTDNWVLCVNYIKRAIFLSAKTGNKKLLNEYLDVIFKEIIKTNGEDRNYFTISIIEILVGQKWDEWDQVLVVLDNIIDKFQDNVHKVECAYRLKSKILSRKKQTAAVMANNCEFAKYYEERAISLSLDNVRDVFLAEKYLKEAIYLYRSNGLPQEGKRAQIILMDVQSNIPNFMEPVFVKKDIGDTYKKIDELFENLSVKEHVVRIIQCVNFYKKEDLKKRVLENAINPMACLFSVGLKNEKGHTITEIPPLDICNPEKDIEKLELHMYQTANSLENIDGEILLKRAILLLNARHEYNKEDLAFLVKNNPIIPDGREEIFLSAIYYGLKGELYLAMHVLAPQTEKLFRGIAEEAGGIVYTLENDGSSNEVLLKSILDGPELSECYDNDILFLFKGMMNEKAGANIRNEIAHGIMNMAKANEGVSIYFLCAVMKLISFTSMECYEIMKGMKKEQS